MTTGEIDEARLEQLMGQMVGHMTGATVCFSIWLGDELGLYRVLARESARTADELAPFSAPEGGKFERIARRCAGFRGSLGRGSEIVLWQLWVCAGGFAVRWGL